MTSILASRQEALVLALTGTKSTTGTNEADVAVVEAAKRGDRAAFGQLYASYARMVHGILLSRVPPGAVEDLMQDVFLQALPKLSSLRDASKFGGWLAAIARNRAIDFHRRSRPGESFDENAHAGEKQEKSLDAKERNDAAIVLEAICTLPDAYRETLILRLVEGMTGPEIAAKTGLTQGSVRVNLHRGMQQLRAGLASKGGGIGRHAK